MHITKWKKSIRKSYTVYDFNCRTFWKRQNYGDEKTSGCEAGGYLNRQSTEDVWGSGGTWYDGTC